MTDVWTDWTAWAFNLPVRLGSIHPWGRLNTSVIENLDQVSSQEVLNMFLMDFLSLHVVKAAQKFIV